MILPDRKLPLQAIGAICRRFQVRELALFGSALRNDFHEDSDIDFLVDFKSTAHIGFLELAAMQRELCELLQRKVDLVPKAGLKPLIRQSVLSSRKVLYAA